MSMLIAAFMFIALLAVSTAHFLWSIGRTWPIRSEKLLAAGTVASVRVEQDRAALAAAEAQVAQLTAQVNVAELPARALMPSSSVTGRV